MALETALPLPPPFYLQAVQRDKCIGKRIYKRMRNFMKLSSVTETLWETVFLELSNNLREPAAILLTNAPLPTHGPPQPLAALPLLPSPPSLTLIHKPWATPIKPPPTAPPELAQTNHTTISTLYHLHFWTSHLPQITTMKKEELHKKILAHHQTKGMLTDIKYFPFQRHSTQTSQKIQSPIQTTLD